jgi:periplasmic protein TonB
MLLSRTEDLKTKLAGGAATIAIESAFIAAIVFGLTASYVESVPKSIQISAIPDAPIVRPPEPPPPAKPLEKIAPELTAPSIDVDVITPPDITNVKAGEYKPIDTQPDLVRVLPEPLPLPGPATSAPVRVRAGFDARYLAALQPDYPASARRMELTGTVELRILIGTDGRVKQADVARSSGHRVLDDAAVAQALRKWRFKPATEDGAPVESWTSVPITFELKQA